MNTEKMIGRKVYEFVEDGHYNYKPDTTKVYTIVKSVDTLDYIIKDDEGNEKKVEYWKVLVLPKWELEEEERIADYLDCNGVYAEVYKDSVSIAVSIEWGDWKHAHLWCGDAMRYIGYLPLNSEVTEEDGSDCYSAIHYFQYFKDTAIVAR